MCDCCIGVQPSTPQPVHNRPGLPAVANRIGEYGQFKASLHAGLTSSERPALAGLTTRADDDFTIALLDATACMADVVTFYNERLLNEAYLRTSTERWSMAELGKLLGYIPRPGVAAATHLAFYVEPPPRPEVDAAAGPFRKMRMPASITIPAGVAVRSVPGPGEQQQVFETSAAIDARPEWNLMYPVREAQPVLGRKPAMSASDPNTTQMYVEGVSANLKAGDVLLFINPAGAWEIRPVATAGTDAKLNHTLVTWRDPLTVAAPLTPHVMRKRLNIFGYNAPMWASMSTDFKKSYTGKTDVSKITEWPDYQITALPETKFDEDEMRVDLDGSHPDVAGGHVILSAGLCPRALPGGQSGGAIAGRVRDLRQGHPSRTRRRRCSAVESFPSQGAQNHGSRRGRRAAARRSTGHRGGHRHPDRLVRRSHRAAGGARGVHFGAGCLRQPHRGR